MSPKKLVILKEAQDLKGFDELDRYFEQPSATTIFVVNYKYKNLDARKKSIKIVGANGLVFRSDKIKDYQLSDWITKYMQSINLKITSKAAMLLVEFLGNDLSRIVNEIDKLKIVLPNESTINDQHIEENIGISKDYNIFELTNALAIKDFVKAFKIVNYFEHNPKAADLIVIIPTIFKFYAQLMRIHFLKTGSREAIAAALKVHPFVAGELLNASKLYNPKKIAQNIEVLHEYDLKYKGIGNTGAFGQGELLKELIYKLLH
jgi:DNA polymerase-3 subunit delta